MGDDITAAAVLGLVGRALRAPGEEGERLRATYGRLLGAVESALAQLPDEARRLLVSHDVDGRTWQEIGAELGCSERTAKRRGAEARKRFALALRAGRERTQGSAAESGQLGTPGAAAG